MIHPPRCKSCGCSIGEHVEAFRRIRQERAKAEIKEKDADPSKAIVNNEIVINMKDVFEGMGIMNDCCRTVMSMTMNFQDHY